MGGKNCAPSPLPLMPPTPPPVPPCRLSPADSPPGHRPTSRRQRGRRSQTRNTKRLECKVKPPQGDNFQNPGNWHISATVVTRTDNPNGRKSDDPIPERPFSRPGLLKA